METDKHEGGRRSGVRGKTTATTHTTMNAYTNYGASQSLRNQSSPSTPPHTNHGHASPAGKVEVGDQGVKQPPQTMDTYIIHKAWTQELPRACPSLPASQTTTNTTTTTAAHTTRGSRSEVRGSRGEQPAVPRTGMSTHNQKAHTTQR